MIWLIGNRGMLGSALCGAFEAHSMDYVGSDREVDILDPVALSAFAEDRKIEWIVNCAAYTAVEKAEEERELCRRLNAEGPENIARTARTIGAKMLHISTDYVFDGSGKRPYREDDQVAPTGWYGETKAEGEARLRASCPEHLIIRTAWLYGAAGPNFVYTMLRLMSTRDKVGVVADQRGTPTSAADLAETLVSVIKRPKTQYGTFHFTNLGEISWYDFACEIQRLGLEYGLLSRKCEISPLTTAEYPTKTRRPAYSVLSKEKIIADYGLKIPDWKDALAVFLRSIEAKDFAATR
jgi:dTDP-4-dehydrorhamnose reductase